MDKGYWIASFEVLDAKAYENYRTHNGVAFKKYGARFLVRGGRFETHEGKGRGRNVVIEFPTYQAALDCWHSSEYKAAMKLREGASSGDLIIIEGYEGSQP